MASSHLKSKSYYSILEVEQNASQLEIRNAYRRLVIKCHPDKCQSADPAKAEMAKLTFQELQEAYSVLSDNRRRALYDLGLEEEDTEELGSFWQEMTSLMADVRTQNANSSRQTSSFEDLQHLFVEMFSADLQNMFGNASGGFAKMSETKPKKTSNCTGQQHSSHTVESKRRRCNPNPQSNS